MCERLSWSKAETIEECERWYQDGVIPTGELLDRYGREIVLEYVRYCAKMVVAATSLDSDSWDDDAIGDLGVIVAHGVILLGV